MHVSRPMGLFLPLQDLCGDDELCILSFTADSINCFFRALNNSGCFLQENVRDQAALAGQRFCEGYATLASLQASRGIATFKLRPKYHMFCEEVRQQAETLYNIMGCSCWSDEDFIGKVSRTARTCSTGATGLAMSVSAITKCLGQCRLQFNRL